MRPQLAAIKRIFILRPDHLGDLILFSGALKHIRQHWPNAKITLCVHPFGLELFRHCPHVDEVVVYEKVRGDLRAEGRLSWMPKVRGSDRLGNWLRKKAPFLAYWAYRSDLALLPVASPFPEYQSVMRMLPSRAKIGVYGNALNQSPESMEDGRSGYLAQLDVSALPWDFPEMGTTRQFLEFLGINVSQEDIWPELWTTPEDVTWADEHIPHQDGRLVFGIAPGKMSDPGRNLPPDWYPEALKGLSAKSPTLVLMGSKQDRDVCAQVEASLSAAGHQTLNLCSQTTIGQSIECIRRCDLLLSQDTAALHIATALRKPVAGILGGGHFGRFYPWGDPQTSRVVNKPMDCYGCNWHCKYDTMRCLQDILPQVATDVLNDLLNTCLPHHQTEFSQ